MRSRRASVIVTGVTGLVVLMAAAGVGAHRRDAGATTSTAAPTAASTVGSATPSAAPAPGATAGAGRRTSSVAAVPGPSGAPTSTPARGLRPARVEVPAIGVDATVGSLGISGDGAIEVPSVPSEAGWLDTTPAPGQQGPAVIAGHVDSETGPAVFYRLSSLQVGDSITVVRGDGTKVEFTVDGVRLYPQSSFPTDQVYGPVPGPALRLITCGGDYVKSDGGYQDNVVVYAS